MSYTKSKEYEFDCGWDHNMERCPKHMMRLVCHNTVDIYCMYVDGELKASFYPQEIQSLLDAYAAIK